MGRRSQELEALMKKATEKKEGPKFVESYKVEKAIRRKIKRVKLEEKAQEFPVEDVDYWVLRQEKNVLCPTGWIHRGNTRSQITKQVMKQVFDNLKLGIARARDSAVFWTQVWLVYPGPKPDKKWGPRCP